MESRAEVTEIELTELDSLELGLELDSVEPWVEAQ